jgi:hypothetical protein
MRHQLFTAAALLLGCNVSMAQVSTMGTTAMGLPTTPGAIVTSSLNGPSPFSAATVPGTPDTTLAPVPLASDPTTPGKVVTCARPTGQITQGIPAVLGTISTSLAVPTTPFVATPIVGSATGSLSPASPPGNASITVCSPTPGGPPANGAALPLSTPQFLSSPPLGTIQPVVAELAGTNIDPNLTVVPTPNSAACSQSVTMSLANPTMMAPANATGATATPGVPPPSGC